MRASATVLGTILLAAACTAGAREPSTTAGRPSPSEASSSRQPGVYVRACDSSVHGELPRDWQKNAVVIGPVAFVGLPGYRDAPDRFFAPRGGRYPFLKVLIVLTGGRRVTVSVAAEDTDRIRLMYDPSTWGDRNLYPIEAGETATVFGPCLPHRSTQFNGGFLVSGRVCATIEVQVGDTEPQRSVVSFGARCARD